jgi:hypothetical protein
MTGQLVGSTIDVGLTILAGIYVLTLFPRHLENYLKKKVERGKMSNGEAQIKAKAFNPKWGWVLIAIGIGRFIMNLLPN